MPRHVDIERETLGTGEEARRGNMVTVKYQLFLNRGEQIQSHEATFTLGERQVVAGLEYGVEGMRVGGRRRIRVGPHLAYGQEGVPGLVPPQAVLIFDLELLAIVA